MFRVKIKLILLCLLFLFACSSPGPSDKEQQSIELTISAASSLADVLAEISNQFEKENPAIKINYNYGASGALQQQIRQGAPIDLFLSAHKDNFDSLVHEGLIEASYYSNLVANELVLIASDQGIHKVNSLEELSIHGVQKVAIGTPETVPAGFYAKQVLEKMDLYTEIEDKLIFAKDVRQVLHYVETGNVDAGIVYRTDALTSDSVRIVVAPEKHLYSSILYPVGVIKGSQNKEAAKLFYAYLKSEPALQLFEEYGFVLGSEL